MPRLPLVAGRCAELQVHVTEAMATTTEQRELIARLEQDLSTIQSIQRPDAEVSPAVPSLPPSVCAASQIDSHFPGSKGSSCSPSLGAAPTFSTFPAYPM